MRWRNNHRLIAYTLSNISTVTKLTTHAHTKNYRNQLTYIGVTECQASVVILRHRGVYIPLYTRRASFTRVCVDPCPSQHSTDARRLPPPGLDQYLPPAPRLQQTGCCLLAIGPDGSGVDPGVRGGAIAPPPNKNIPGREYLFAP